MTSILDNVKMVYKIAILLAVSAVALLAVGYTGYDYLHKSNDDIKVMYGQKMQVVQLLDENRVKIRLLQIDLQEMISTQDKNLENKAKADMEKQMAEFEKNLAAYDDLSKNVAEAQAGLATMRQSWQAFKQNEARAVELATHEKDAEAYALYNGQLRSEMDKANKDLDSLADLANANAKKLSEQNAADFVAADRSMLLKIAVALLVLLLVGAWITRMITKSLQMMVDVCNEFEAGDFRDHERRLHRRDEFGHLSDALFNARSNIRKLMTTINDSSGQLAASSEELTASVAQSAEASAQTAETITKVAGHVERQQVALSDTAKSVQKVEASVEEIAVHATAVAERSAEAAAKAGEGNESVSKAVSQMQSVEKTVASTAQLVDKLGERSQEIGQIVDTIAGIAGQTNLLALNAAIEAARAGEQGRGFAVVAEEVRKLAEQSQEAAKQIAELIGAIQQDTEKAVDAMKAGRTEVGLGAQAVNSSGAVFEKISELVQAVSGQVQEISQAIANTAKDNEAVTASIEKIDEFSKKVSGETQSVSAVTEEQSASAEEIASASDSLAGLAQNLRNAVKKFKL